MSTQEEREVGFIINLPIITAENTDRLKAVMNVGFWVVSHKYTPSLIAYHSNPGLYLAHQLE